MGTPTTGALSKFAFDTALPFDTSSIPMEILSNTLKKQGNILSTDGLRGTRQYHRTRTRFGPATVSGQVTLVASPIALDYLLPCILGAAEATDVFDLAETLPSFYLMQDIGAKVLTWSGCIVSRATFRAQAGQFLLLILDVEAQTQSIGNAGTFPVLTMPTDSPYVMSDAVLTLIAVAREIGQVEIVIDNQLDTARFQNALYRSSFPSSGVLVTMNSDHPWTTDEIALVAQALIGAVGSLVFTNADVAATTLTIALGFLQTPEITPEVGGRGELRLPLSMVARQFDTTPTIRITNVHA